MIKRRATAVWNGSGKEGSGVLSTTSGVLKDTKYSFGMRFGDDPGTNPEELIAAAHAGCFSMKLSFVLGAAGVTPDSISTKAVLSFENGTVTNIHLDTKVKVAGIDEDKFQECANEAKLNCPVSKLLNTEITLTASLV